MSAMTGKTSTRQRPRNPTIQNFLPKSIDQAVSDNSKVRTPGMTPCVSINTTSQLCLNKDAREFPFMQVGSQSFV